MASSWAELGSVLRLQRAALCSICMDFYKNPVSVPCGHNYCRICISLMLARDTDVIQEVDGALKNVGVTDSSTGQPTLFPKQEVIDCRDGNTLLCSWFGVEFQLSREEGREAERQKRGDQRSWIGQCHPDGVLRVHPENLLICPQCRAAFREEDFRPNLQLANMAQIISQICSPHPTRQVLGRRMCPKHQESMTLFCEVDEEIICVVCRESRRHKQHSVVSLDEKVNEYKKTRLRKP